MQNFLALGAPPPDPHAFGCWGFFPQTPSLQRLGASPPDPIGLRQLGAQPPDPQNSPPIANFWLRAWYQLRAMRSNVKTFLIFTYIWQKDVAKMSKVPGAQRDVNSPRQ